MTPIHQLCNAWTRIERSIAFFIVARSMTISRCGGFYSSHRVGCINYTFSLLMIVLPRIYFLLGINFFFSFILIMISINVFNVPLRLFSNQIQKPNRKLRSLKLNKKVNFFCLFAMLNNKHPIKIRIIKHKRTVKPIETKNK